MANQAAIFIDGGYLQKVLFKEFQSPRLDFLKLATFMAGDDELFRAYYYNCLPFQGTHPSQQESERYGKARRFLDALDRLPRFEVRLGRLAARGVDPQTGKTIFQQKRVDIMLGVDLVLLAAKGRIHRAALFTGDSDFIPAVKAAKNEGVHVHLFHGNKAEVHDEIWTAADDRTQMTAELIKSVTMA